MVSDDEHQVTPPASPPQIDLAAFRARQRARNRVLGLVMAGLAVLFFAITIVKLGMQGPTG